MNPGTTKSSPARNKAGGRQNSNKNDQAVSSVPTSPRNLTSPRTPTRRATPYHPYLQPSSESLAAPLVNMAYQGDRHLHPQRLPSAKKERAVSIRLLDVNESTVQSIRTLSSTLKRLDMNRMHLEYLDDEMLSGLTELQKLDISFNELNEDGLPDSLEELQQLKELNLYGNKIRSIPEVIKKLKNLTRLFLGENQLESVRGLEKLKKLTCLTVSHNKLKSIIKEIMMLRKLEIVHCNGNVLKDIPKEIKYLKVLKELDISENMLTSLPVEVFQLPNLEVLDASGNQIARVPILNIKGPRERRIAQIDLSGNQIIRMPEYLLLCADKLDLSSNRIKKIQGDFIKKLDWKTEQELILDDNPISTPNRDTCEGGLRSMVQYFQEQYVERKVYQGVKVIVLGAEGAGKSSLVLSLVDGQAHLIDLEEISPGVECHDLVVDLGTEDEKNLHVALWDTSGDPFYLASHTPYIDSQSLILLVFNLATYKSECFQEQFGIYLDWLICKNNNLRVLIVGTNSDKVNSTKAKNIKDEVLKRLKGYISSYKSGIEQEVKLIESRPQISSSLSEQLKYYMNLLKHFNSNIHPEIVTCSSKDFSGVLNVQTALATMAQNHTIFPDVMRVIPSMWVYVENYLEDLGNAMVIPVISWEEYEEKVTAKYGMRHLLENITNYLHNTGKLLWFSRHPKLSNLVFLRPSWLHSVLSIIVRHNVQQALDYTNDDIFRLMGMNNFRFDRLKNELLKDGVFDRDLMKCLWYILGIKSSSHLNEVINMMSDNFELCYAVGKKDRHGKYPPYDYNKKQRPSQLLDASDSQSIHTLESNLSLSRLPSNRSSILITDKSSTHEASKAMLPESSSRPSLSSESNAKSETSSRPTSAVSSRIGSSLLPRIGRILIPLYRHTKKPENIDEEWKQFEEHPRIATFYRFPRYCPPGFFQQFSIKANHRRNNIVFLDHWESGFLAQHPEKQVRLLVTSGVKAGDSAACHLKLELRSEIQLSEMNQIEELWSVLHPLLLEVEEMLSVYAGVRFERYTECPVCFKSSFLGEWMTPKDLQAVNQRTCEACQNSIHTAFLIQPKTKKSVEVLWNIAHKLQKRKKTMKRLLKLRAQGIEDSD